MKARLGLTGLIGLIGFTQLVAFRVYAAEHNSARLNTVALNFACELIAQGRCVADKKGAWSNHHPVRSRENDFVREHGFAEYARWYLVVDERHAPDSKARYKFPFGDFQNVHRCGLLAIKARAREYGYPDVEAAATKLLQMIESAHPPGQKRVD